MVMKESALIDVCLSVIPIQAAKVLLIVVSRTIVI